MTQQALYALILSLMHAPASLPPPRIVLTDHNSYTRGEIHVRADQCFITSFAHELSHHVAIETGMLTAIPNDRVKQRLEEIARDVERRLPVYEPNCDGTHAPGWRAVPRAIALMGVAP